jgi:hypothetical protein
MGAAGVGIGATGVKTGLAKFCQGGRFQFVWPADPVERYGLAELVGEEEGVAVEVPGVETGMMPFPKGKIDENTQAVLSNAEYKKPAASCRNTGLFTEETSKLNL